MKKIIVLTVLCFSVLLAQKSFAIEECRDLSDGSFRYEDDDFPVIEQMKIAGGFDCRCLPAATHPDFDHGHNNTFPQVIREENSLFCSFQAINYRGTQAEQSALRTCSVKFTGVHDLVNIPMKRIKMFTECVDKEITLNR
ncbi:MAG: hypothetical protein SGJ18_08775 [Pseudomonadota bacterium]|nr:hypothetical protein [Pseudomonadota bacterium]